MTAIHPSLAHLQRYSPSRSMLYPAIPIEVLHHIFEGFGRDELVPVLLANKALHEIAVKLLYHTLSNMMLKQSVECLISISRSSTLPLLVRTLEINWQLLTPTTNLYKLLQKTLQQTKFLTSLVIDLPKAAAPYWVLDGCKFKLTQFTTSLPCKLPLAKFLDVQPGIVNLTLRGFQEMTSSILPLFYPGFASTTPARRLGVPTDFALQPASLPNLRQFRVVHAGPAVIEAVVRGRPVQVVSVPLFSASSEEALDALALSAKPITRLSLMSFDPHAPYALLPQVVERFPDLEALHVVILMADYTPENLEASSGPLSKLKSLRYITFMASPFQPETQLSFADEQTIARSWHQHCPTLKTIILPRGRVWFEGKSGWDCLEESESKGLQRNEKSC